MGRGTMGGEMLQTVTCFGDCWEVTSGNPPEAGVRGGHFLEPTLALAEHLDMVGLIGEGLQRIDGLPDGHVHNHQWVAAIGNIGSVATLGF